MPKKLGLAGVGKRLKLALTRATINLIHSGNLAMVRTTPDLVFGIGVVSECPEVPREVLTPRDTWSDKASYDATARKLAGLFRANVRQYQKKSSHRRQGRGTAGLTSPGTRSGQWRNAKGVSVCSFP